MGLITDRPISNIRLTLGSWSRDWKFCQGWQECGPFSHWRSLWSGIALTSLINDSNAARLVLVSSRAFARSILYKMLLLHSICLWQPHEGHETLVNQITSDVCQPFGAVWLAVSFWAHDMQIDEPLLPINALCFVDKPTWVSVFLVEEGEAYLRYSVQPLILIRRKMT